MPRQITHSVPPSRFLFNTFSVLDRVFLLFLSQAMYFTLLYRNRAAIISRGMDSLFRSFLCKSALPLLAYLSSLKFLSLSSPTANISQFNSKDRFFIFCTILYSYIRQAILISSFATTACRTLRSWISISFSLSLFLTRFCCSPSIFFQSFLFNIFLSFY